MTGEWPLQASVPGRNAGAGPTLSRAERGCGTGTSRYRSTGWSKGMFTTPVSYLGPVRSGPAKHDLLGAGKIIAIHDSVPRANGGASYNGSGLKSPHSRSSPGPCRAAVVCSLGVGPRGPRASGHRIHMYAGPVSWVSNVRRSGVLGRWVSNCYHGFHGGTVYVLCTCIHRN